MFIVVIITKHNYTATSIFLQKPIVLITPI